MNVSFFGGANFDPPPPLGTTDRTRYVKVKTLEEAQGPDVGNRQVVGARRTWPTRLSTVRRVVVDHVLFVVADLDASRGR